jgi:hypothetical protein
MVRELRRFLKDESGEIVDWVVLTAILILTTIVTLRAIGVKLNDILVRLQQTLEGIANL